MGVLGIDRHLRKVAVIFAHHGSLSVKGNINSLFESELKTCTLTSIQSIYI